MHQILGIVTPNDAEDLRNMSKYNNNISDFSHQTIKKIANTYQKELDDQELILSKPSYWRIEHKSKGHDWHYDGCKEANGKLVDNHMAWCNIGTSILLSKSDEYTGGALKFLVDGQEVTIHNHYLSGVMYSADKHNNPLKHKVEPHKGNRVVLLMFFATKPVSQDQLKGN